MFGLLLELIIFDINMWVIARGTQTTRSDVNQSNAILTKIFPNGIKKTYLQYSVLAINIIVFLLRTGLAVNAYVESSDSFQEAISSIGPWAYKNIISNLWWVLAIAVETIIAMSVVYCAVKVSDTGENRRLNVTELDQEYLEFSKPESIDARSDLILIAGDLSFLGVIPKKESIPAEQKENCKKYLGTGAELSKYCEETCPLDAQLENSKSKCMGKSKQFAQLLELREKEVVLKVNCLVENTIPNDSYALFGVFGDVLSPETNNCPPKIIQFSIYFIVPFHITAYFLFPIFRIYSVSNPGEQYCIPILSMKEFTVAEDGNFIFGQHYIRFSRQSSVVFSVAVSTVPQSLSEFYFNGRVFGANTRHRFVPLFPC